MTLQYWIFYAYNDGVGGQNHEGDWEHVAVKLNASQTPAAVVFSTHGHLNTYAPGDVGWHEGTHPRVWVADGSHAAYRSESACDTTLNEGVLSSCWTIDGQRWFTWAGGRGTAPGIQGAGLVALGEKAHPASGQQWIRYSGRWGEKGTIDGSLDHTSGPRGPAYQSSWNHQRALTGGTGGTGGGGGGGGGDECLEEPQLLQGVSLPGEEGLLEAPGGRRGAPALATGRALPGADGPRTALALPECPL